jgi:hypothetical protein
MRLAARRILVRRGSASRKDQQSAFDLASRLLALYECQLAFTAGAGGSG